MAFVSIVSPVYNTGSSLSELVQRLHAAIGKTFVEYELIFVDDGSTDQSWDAIEKYSLSDDKIKGIKLSRNFGQHAAITAGLAASRGEWIVVMDSDLQDAPEDITAFYQKAITGFEVVLGDRDNRADEFLRRFFSRVFNGFLRWLTDGDRSRAVGNFGIFSRKVIDQVLLMKEYHRYFPMLINLTGFSSATVKTHATRRSQGRSGYSYSKLIRLALSTALSYSDKPLRYIVKIGFGISFLTFIFGLIILIKYLTGHILVIGYASIILSIWFLGGVLLFTLGVVGLYVGKIFEEVKKRPVYIIEKIIE